jgi:hypothetical protein
MLRLSGYPLGIACQDVPLDNDEQERFTKGFPTYGHGQVFGR